MINRAMHITWLATGLLLVSCGGGGGSTATSVETPSTPVATTPGPPTGVTVTAADGTLVVSFSTPGSDGGASISGYTATCTAGTVSRTSTGTASPLTVGGLTNGTQYSCFVVATNRIGSGAASSAVSATPVSASATADGGCRLERSADESFVPSARVLGGDYLDPETAFDDEADRAGLMAWSTPQDVFVSTTDPSNGEVVVGSRFRLNAGLTGTPNVVQCQPDIGSYAGGKVVSFSLDGRGYVATVNAGAWSVAPLRVTADGQTSFTFVWPSQHATRPTYFFHFMRTVGSTTEIRLGEVTDLSTGAVVDWGLLGLRNRTGGLENFASPRFVPNSNKILAPVVTETGEQEMRIFEIPAAVPAAGAPLPSRLLVMPAFYEMTPVTAESWPGMVGILSRSADSRCFEIRLFDPSLPVASIPADLPVGQRICIRDANYGTEIINAEFFRKGASAYLMFITREARGSVNHIWLAEIGEGKTWQRRIDTRPAGDATDVLTDPEWSCNGRCVISYSRGGSTLTAWDTGLQPVGCPR